MSDTRRAFWIIGVVLGVSLEHSWHVWGPVFLALMALTPWSRS